MNGQVTGWYRKSNEGNKLNMEGGECSERETEEGPAG